MTDCIEKVRESERKSVMYVIYVIMQMHERERERAQEQEARDATRKDSVVAAIREIFGPLSMVLQQHLNPSTSGMQ
jgi:hypothetical protein